jgi:BlaI family penicillinase repressor
MKDTARNLPKPTEFELDLLRALWKRGSGTVRDLHEDLNTVRPLGYTSILKTLQIMTEKGLVQRTESGKAHIYRAAASQEQTQNQLVRDLSLRLFSGSAGELAMRALSMQRASDAEIEQIKLLIEHRKEQR